MPHAELEVLVDGLVVLVAVLVFHVVRAHLPARAGRFERGSARLGALGPHGMRMGQQLLVRGLSRSG